ncbi:hypothetical protein QFZ49_003656 [Streptomyces turgidiscabies]|uniref:Transposase n=1 Tax=Streptomyces turgidiscabies TaxID=85558 RepID=A0ABU0RNZ4_9ACTN|nr:hypothetical protein [Streptomyces turgidiscabies]
MPRPSARVRRAVSYAARASALRARVAQGADEEGVQRFVVRVSFRQLLQLRYGVVGVAQSQVRLHARACRLAAQGLRAGRGGAVREVGQDRAMPEGEGLGEGACGCRGVGAVQGGLALPYEAFEEVEVDVVLGCGQALTCTSS